MENHAVLARSRNRSSRPRIFLEGGGKGGVAHYEARGRGGATRAILVEASFFLNKAFLWEYRPGTCSEGEGAVLEARISCYNSESRGGPIAGKKKEASLLSSFRRVRVLELKRGACRRSLS